MTNEGKEQLRRSNWKKPIPTTDQVCRSRWKLQVSASQPDSVWSLFDLFFQNVSPTYWGTRASANRINIWNLIYIRKELNHYWNVRWTMKRSLH